MEQKSRLRKFKREKDAFSGMQIQPRDIEILKDLADYRFLNTEQIIALHGESHRNIKLRLQKLFHNGFVDRVGQHPSYPRPQGHMVYGLSNRAANLLAEHFPDFERKNIDWLTKNKETSQKYIAHRLMISNFRVVLNLALRQHEGVSLFRWWQGKVLKDYVIVHDKKIRKVPIVPDGLFTLEDANNAMDFFVEADQSTMDLKRMFWKMRAYWEWYCRWDKRNGEPYNQKLDVGPFRVLMLCKTEDRKENLQYIAREADPKGIGLSMFYFASEKNFDLGDPSTILKPIWQTPINESYHSLLE
jgi:hypothetical protein